MRGLYSDRSVSPRRNEQTRIPDKETMRSQPFAVCLALAFALPFGAAAQADPQQSEPSAPAAAASPAATGNAEAGRTLA